MPIRFSYNDLSKATKSFSTKVGQGGFGSVYLGVLPDGTQLAVKKLESFVQGKEFGAEVKRIKDNPISEKTDVYSYGVVLLEIISGRRSYDPGDGSEKSHFPTYAFKMLEEGKLSEILDPRLDIDENHESVVNLMKVALWCIQDVVHLRPPMTKVVQMLKSLCAVPQPPTFSVEFPGML
ncbi:hypothetical protein Patl1_34512 [Pistacia atlantica]|uniref:Uncharacterized protein n=1 Tax=Pistacia atlantica TaxID=434234 RepID=A0ACC0ZWA2_9ROSI|nr:hypothetical protein Patl1_34512 [Pistacia atlantica]